MQEPKVAILHYSAPPIIGGVESTLSAHARLLADHGYAVKIIAGRGEQFDPRVPIHIIPIVDSKHPFVLEANRHLAGGKIDGDLHALSKALGHALAQASEGVDVCIAHNVLTLHKNLALSIALHEMVQARRVRLIAWCHDFAWRDPVYAHEMHEGWPWDLLRQVWAGVKYVVISEGRRKELAYLLGLAEEEIAVVPPGLDVCEFLGISETTSRWVRELKLLDTAPLLLLPARVTRRKNIELAVEITAALREHGLAPKLVVMGPLGPHNPANCAYLEELRERRKRRDLEEAVIFLQDYGPVDDVTRRDLYWLADVLLFTSWREGFGIPILEAGLTRLPIFCADIPPFRESAGEYAHYFAFDESPTVIAERIVQFLAQDDRYQLKRRVVREYAWSRIFKERIEPLLKEIYE
ncbi:MAG: glycosyltransferase family 4 protein [Chloroflexota bacterium]